MKDNEIAWPKDSPALQMFFNELAEGITLLTVEEQTQNTNQLLTFFHKTKGAAGMFGMKSLGDLAAKIEQELKDTNKLPTELVKNFIKLYTEIAKNR